MVSSIILIHQINEYKKIECFEQFKIYKNCRKTKDIILCDKYLSFLKTYCNFKNI